MSLIITASNYTYHVAAGSNGGDKYYRTAVAVATDGSGSAPTWWAAFNWGAGDASGDGNWWSGQTQVQGPYNTESAAQAAANKKVSTKVSKGYSSGYAYGTNSSPGGIHNAINSKMPAPGVSSAEPLPDGPAPKATGTGFTLAGANFATEVAKALGSSNVQVMLERRAALMAEYTEIKRVLITVDAAMELLEDQVRAKLSA